MRTTYSRSPKPSTASPQAGGVRFGPHPGDAVLLYTDGITEARTGDRGPLFGEDCLTRALSGTHDADAGTTLARLQQVATTHAGGYAGDDTALVLLRVSPSPPGPGGNAAGLLRAVVVG
ncbi:SpoIIE family protein phosphatase [Streptomyces sp. NPDC002698]|uniref:SpoIIE family protein phosphatase n=1 Tax=Streptomyces sp. NPDC002698 TaxID=3364660 RepID=UPI0036CECF99